MDHLPLPDEIARLIEARIAQAWCEEVNSHKPMDVDLAQSIAKNMKPIINGWYQDAAMHSRNTDYYRGLIQDCGKHIGDEAYVADDGSISQDVLCAKIPELVEQMMKNLKNNT